MFDTVGRKKKERKKQSARPLDRKTYVKDKV